MDKKKKLEQAVAQVLTDGEMKVEDPKQDAPDHLPPRYEARIQTTTDPIVKETKLFRELAKEIDDRYDKYLK